ncbi:MAG: pyridoxine kinase [Methylobacteriaceae bacterium]|jgi:pyridoxine kinase|nr:pyridoxine kinase [Methylobacteriaceae bacterium]
MNLLSIQSHVAYGHVGNSAAVFPIQRLGHEVWPIHTVQFSNHTGYGAWRGEVLPASIVDECVEGIVERGALASCDGVLSGYMGSAETGEAILRAVARVKAANPQALYCCDPVIGDASRGIFVRDGIPQLLASLVLPAADIITPNQFELEFLSERSVADEGSARAGLARLHAIGPKVTLVTSLHLDDTPLGAIDIVASEPGEVWRVRTPCLDIAPNGAGDCIAALFFVHWLTTRSAKAALERAVASVFGIISRTAAANSRELLLVAAQEEFVAPTRRFEAQPL